MKYKLIFILLIIVLLSISFLLLNITPEVNLQTSYNIDYKYKNLMVVAHPDDELLWGGAHIKDGNYYVVCVTCGVDEKREIEFINVMNKTHNKFISLGYVDKTNNKRDDWSKYYNDIENDIKKIIDKYDWDMVVTHNPDGEYGHIHHMLVSKMVSNNVDKDKLYYFNKYYNNEELKKLKNTDGLSDKDFYDKLSLLTNYSSQKDIINNHLKNIRFERFISYKDWK